MAKNIKVQIDAKDMASNKIKEVKKHIDNLPKFKDINVKVNTQEAMSKIQNLKNKLADLKNGSSFGGGAIGGAIGGMVGAGLSMAMDTIAGAVGKAKAAFFDYNAQMEQTNIAFTSMLGSSEKAAKVMGDLKKFAADTPFEFSDIAPAAQQLKAFGFSAKELIPTLTAVGNASSGLGKGTEGLKQMTFVLGQIKSTGKLMGQDVMQLAGLGVPVKEILAKNLGLTADELARIGELGIDADTAIQALIKGMNDSFPEMMAKQSNTALGMLSTISDNINQIMARIGTGIFESTKNVIAGIKDMMETLLNNVNEKGLKHIFDNLIPNDLASNFTRICTIIEQAWENVMNVLGTAWNTIKDVISDSTNHCGNSIDIILDIITGFINRIQFVSAVVVGYFSDMVDLIRTVQTAIRSIINNILGYFRDMYNSLLKGLGSWGKGMFDGISKILKTLAKLFGDFVDFVLDKMGAIGVGIRKVASVLGKNVGGGIFDFIKNTRTFQTIANFKPITGIDTSVNSSVNDTNDYTKPKTRANNKSAGAGASGGGRSAVDNIKDTAKEIEDITNRLKENFKNLEDKIISETGTNYEKAFNNLKNSIASIKSDIQKAMNLGIDTTPLKEKLAEYEEIINEGLVKKVKEAQEDLRLETELTTAKIIENKEKEAEILLQMEINKLNREKELKLREVAFHKDSANEKLLVEDYYQAKLQLLQKNYAKDLEKAPQDYNKAWKLSLKDMVEKMKENLKDAKSVTDSVVGSMVSTIENQFVNILKGDFKSVAKAFKDMVNSMLSAIMKLVAQQAIVKWVDPMVKKWFGGGKAVGGPVSYGKPYIVGERGPELFIPHQAGKISNNLSGIGLNNPPNIKVIVNNNGNKMDARTETKFDGSSWVTNIVLDAITTNKNGMRDAIKGAV